MDFATIIGFIVGFIAIFGLGCRWEFMPYFDVPSVGLVFGGTAASVFIALSMREIKAMPRTFMMAFKSARFDYEDIIQKMIQFSDVSRREGILSLENQIEGQRDPFLRQGLQLAVDGKDDDLISSVLNTTIDSLEQRHESSRRGWEVCRGMAPSWGAMGTVIGLVQMVKGGVEDPNALIMGIAIALLTTFYGSLISTWVAGPVCDKLAERTAAEVMYKTIIARGILSLTGGDPPRVMGDKLRAFLNAKSDVADRE